MCGVIGAVSGRLACPLLIDGLSRLEYRGYDSAGVVTLADNRLYRCRTVGAVDRLQETLREKLLPGNAGIAHTRWATHGPPTEENAHPHFSHDRVAVVHNGIIENAEQLRPALRQKGYEFTSQTDTEIIAHLVHLNLVAAGSLLEAVRAALSQLHGQYAIAVVCLDETDTIVVARRGCPLLIGLGENENFIASDATALVPYTNRLIDLQDGDIARVTREQVRVIDVLGHDVAREPRISTLSTAAIGKDGYPHFMQKEIHEQPVVLTRTVERYLSANEIKWNAFNPAFLDALRQAECLHFIACGTSYHAALFAKYIIESRTGIPCIAEQASEYRYRTPAIPPRTMLATISQSGETADTLAALRAAKQGGYLATLGVCNVPESSLARESDQLMLTEAGPEIGVASTKAFTTQMIALALLVDMLSQLRNPQNAGGILAPHLRQIPELVKNTLEIEPAIRIAAAKLVNRDHALFIGRGVYFPIALEGALKLKEISYIHAEAYPGGELKHGPLALVDRDMPVIAIAPNDALFGKIWANIEEIEARGGRMIVLTEPGAGIDVKDHRDVIQLPTGSAIELGGPFKYTAALQLLAYHVAVLRGTDVDKPRNLAKSVTVE